MKRFARIAMIVLATGALAMPCQPASAQPLGSAITYQGVLKNGASPYTGTADFVFRLFNASVGGAVVGGPIAQNAVAVVDGTFTVSLDFGMAAYDGNERWLNIEVHTPGNGGIPPFTTLAPRQRLAAAPYALRSLAAIISGVQPNALSFTNATNSFVGSSLSIDGGTLHVDSVNNRVGIGTTTPFEALTIASSATDTARLIGPGGFWQDARMRFQDDFGNVYLHNDIDGGLTINTNSGLGGRLALTGGNVGIGVLAPQKLLHVGSASTPDSEGMVRLESRSGTGGSTRSWQIGVPETDEDLSGPGYSFVIDDTQLGVDPEFVLHWGTGNVGIGINNPSHKLTVRSPDSSTLSLLGPGGFTTLARLQFQDPGFAHIDNDGDGNLTILAANRLALTGGNVGIGTTSPGTKVHIVDGTAGMNTLHAVNTAAAGANVASGVVGITSQVNANAAGVKGMNLHASGTGIIGTGNNSAPTVLGAGSGGAFTGVTTGVYGNSTTGGAGEGLFTHQFGNVVRVNHWNGSTQFKIIGAGTVSTIVRDVAEQPVTMFAPESPEVLFQDFGDGMLINGFAHIELDPTFAKNVLIDPAHPMRVFIQLEGDENCQGVVVKNKTATGFDVVELRGGLSNTPFQYQITCSRADETLPSGRLSKYADLRFPPAPEATPTVAGEVDANGQVGQVMPQVDPNRPRPVPAVEPAPAPLAIAPPAAAPTPARQ